VSTLYDQKVRQLCESGYKEITFLGQNVNSYHDKKAAAASAVGSPNDKKTYEPTPGFTNLFRSRGGDGHRFVDLLDQVEELV